MYLAACSGIQTGRNSVQPGDTLTSKPTPSNALEYLKLKLDELFGRRIARDEEQKEWRERSAAARKAKEPKPAPLEEQGNFFDDATHRRLKQAYEACRAYVLKVCNMAVITFGDCSSDKFVENFASDPDDMVWLEVDEATTVHEPSSYIPWAKCYHHYGGRIISTSMYGDEKQLGPVVFGNLGQNRGVAYNEFGMQINTSLFDRLIMTGCPVVRLEEQNRAVPTYFEPWNIFFFDGQITSTRTNIVYPPLWEQTFRQELGIPDDQQLSEKQKCVVYYEIEGTTHTKTSNDTGSRANMKSVNEIVRLVLGPLLTIWGESMRENVGIITLYRRQHTILEGNMRDLQRLGRSLNSLPQIVTADSSMGGEINQVVLDFVDCDPDDMGFCIDIRRMCVFFARAMLGAFMVGGNLPPSSKGDNRGSRKHDEDGGPLPKLAMMWAHQYFSTCISLAGSPADLDVPEWPTVFWEKLQREHLTIRTQERQIPFAASGGLGLLEDDRIFGRDSEDRTEHRRPDGTPKTGWNTEDRTEQWRPDGAVETGRSRM